MIRSIEMFRESGVNAANVVVVATHGSDELSSGASEAVIRALNVQGFPSAYFNLNPNLLNTDTLMKFAKMIFEDVYDIPYEKGEILDYKGKNMRNHCRTHFFPPHFIKINIITIF